MQTSGTTPTAATFVNTICGNMGWLQSTCTSQLQVDVRTEAQFTSPTEPDPMSTGTFNSAVLTFNPGTAGQIVLVRAFYQWPLILPVFDAALSRGIQRHRRDHRHHHLRQRALFMIGRHS